MCNYEVKLLPEEILRMIKSVFILRKKQMNSVPLKLYYFASVCLHRDSGFSLKNYLKILQFVMFSINFLTAKPRYLKLYQLYPMGNVGSWNKIQTQD